MKFRIVENTLGAPKFKPQVKRFWGWSNFFISSSGYEIRTGEYWHVNKDLAEREIIRHKKIKNKKGDIIIHKIDPNIGESQKEKRDSKIKKILGW